ncbi:MAG: HmuY family protein [Chitinophagaceae bacterium]
MKKSNVFAFVLLSAVFFYACTKDDNATGTSTLTSNVVKDLVADTIVGLVNGQPVGVGKFTFYSLENNAVVPSTDSNSTKWDIAFRGTTIITNAGTSGPGAGGAFVYTGTFDELETVPTDSTFKKDNAPTSYAITSGSNKGWYVYDPVNNLITPIPGRVLVIKTAKGNFAKVEIMNYYKGGSTPAPSASDDIKLKTQRFYTFRFVHQANGTASFQ